MVKTSLIQGNSLVDNPERSLNNYVLFRNVQRLIVGLSGSKREAPHVGGDIV